MFHDHAGYLPSARETDKTKLLVPEHLDFQTAADEERWRSRASRGEARMNKRDAQALAEQPDGKVLFVQTKFVAQRSRMGIAFTNNARRKVVVVDKSDEEVAALNATGGVDMPNLNAKDGGQATTEKVAAVTPLGAKAILSDDGLLVYEAPAAVAEAQVAVLKDQLASANAELVELRKLRDAKNDPDATRSTRLDQKRSTTAPATSDTQVDPKK